ncbi:hypothetical protein CARUB_v10026822mg [Capsella rubella]|uniref:Uncharacterized protein n=1 Tax=Capsella rubella TaxID=81985 RepID=R0GJT7_9BRAS|nr:myb-related protein 308 [Capsella rubella]XP_023640471.1 myb-related protein 308 [Capsella rubella]EOA12555.1 hypothetical protein CARUB_v10026822mg [Capsella rubella]
MGRSPGSDEAGLKKGPWLPEEDDKLIKYIHKHGHSSWSALPKLAGLNRCGKSCRLRWTNYLRPDIKRGKFSPEEEETILNLHAVLGNKWSMIASHLPGRTDNEIKNFWNTHLKKKLIQMGFDPMTHRPRTDDIFSSLSQLMSLSNLRGVADLQHQVPIEEQALLNLHAEMAKLQLFQYLLQPPPMSSTSINPNDLSILNLLIKENSNTSNLDLGFLSSHLQDFNNNLPSLKALDDNHFSQKSSPIWFSEPPSLNQTMLPFHDPCAQSVDGFCGNQASSSQDQEVAVTDAVEWPDQQLFDDSMFPDIPYQS